MIEKEILVRGVYASILLTAAMLWPVASAGAAPDALEGVACPFPVPFGDAASCGYLVVPQRHDGPADPNAPPVRMFFAILHAEAGAPAPDPIVMLAGGPGQGMSDFVDAVWSGQAADLATRDVILVDQRGTGRSEPLLDCPIDDDILDSNAFNDDPDSALPARQREILAACRAGFVDAGVDLDAFDTEAAARDLRGLREALGIAHWNLVGTSYGTRLALEAARQDPDGIRSLVLNSTMTMGDALEPRIFDDRRRILLRLFDDCAADATCGRAFPDLAASFERTRRRLAETPLIVEVPGPDGGTIVPVPLDADAYVGLIMAHMGAQPSIEIIPAIVHSLDEVVAGRLALAPARWEHILGPALAGPGGIAFGLHLSVMCREVAPITDYAAVEARVQALGGVFSPRSVVTYRDTCGVWDVGTARDGFAAPVSTDIPALLLIGEYDPMTPPYWTEQALKHLPNGRAVTFAGLSHDVLGTSACARYIASAFVRDPAARLDTACATRHDARFYVPEDMAG